VGRERRRQIRSFPPPRTTCGTPPERRRVFNTPTLRATPPERRRVFDTPTLRATPPERRRVATLWWCLLGINKIFTFIWRFNPLKALKLVFC
jgi:hypothetical protein